MNYPRQWGKAHLLSLMLDLQLSTGQHVHVASTDGMRCAGGEGADDCPLWQRQLDQLLEGT